MTNLNQRLMETLEGLEEVYKGLEKETGSSKKMEEIIKDALVQVLDKRNKNLCDIEFKEIDDTYECNDFYTRKKFVQMIEKICKNTFKDNSLFDNTQFDVKYINSVGTWFDFCIILDCSKVNEEKYDDLLDFMENKMSKYLIGDCEKYTKNHLEISTSPRIVKKQHDIHDISKMYFVYTLDLNPTNYYY